MPEDVIAPVKQIGEGLSAVYGVQSWRIHSKFVQVSFAPVSISPHIASGSSKELL